MYQLNGFPLKWSTDGTPVKWRARSAQNAQQTGSSQIYEARWALGLVQENLIYVSRVPCAARFDIYCTMAKAQRERAFARD